MVTLALMGHDSGDHSALLMPGSRPAMVDTLYGKADLSLSSGPLPPFFWHTGCWPGALFVAPSPFQRHCARLPGHVSGDSTGCTKGCHCQSFHASTQTPVCGNHVPSNGSEQPVVPWSTPPPCVGIRSPSQLHTAALSLLWFSTAISPVTLKVDCGKDKTFGRGYS